MNDDQGNGKGDALDSNSKKRIHMEFAAVASVNHNAFEMFVMSDMAIHQCKVIALPCCCCSRCCSTSCCGSCCCCCSHCFITSQVSHAVRRQPDGTCVHAIWCLVTDVRWITCGPVWNHHTDWTTVCFCVQLNNHWFFQQCTEGRVLTPTGSQIKSVPVLRTALQQAFSFFACLPPTGKVVLHAQASQIFSCISSGERAGQVDHLVMLQPVLCHIPT